MNNKSNYECWISDDSKTLSFHLVENYIRKTFRTYKDFFSYVITLSQHGYKVQ
jgi:hypothetical protein